MPTGEGQGDRTISARATSISAAHSPATDRLLAHERSLAYGGAPGVTVVKSATFKVGPLILHWYGLIIAIALIAGLLISLGVARLYRQRAGHLPAILLLGVLAGVVAARAWYVGFNRGFYAPDPGKAFAVWEGGMALQGGIAGAILATLIYTWSMEIDFWTWADICAPGLILGQAIGRVGDLVNNQAFGPPTTGSFSVTIPPDNRPLEYLGYAHFQPTAAYEGLWDALIFLLLVGLVLLVRRRTQALPVGSVFLAYLILYSVGRIPLESMRVDSLMLGQARVAQVAAAIAIAVGVVLYVARVARYGDEDHELPQVVAYQPTDAYLAAAMRGSQTRATAQMSEWTGVLPGATQRGLTATTVLPQLPSGPTGKLERIPSEGHATSGES